MEPAIAIQTCWTPGSAFGPSQKRNTTYTEHALPFLPFLHVLLKHFLKDQPAKLRSFQSVIGTLDYQYNNNNKKWWLTISS